MQTESQFETGSTMEQDGPQKIRVISTVGETKNIEFTGTTYGQLKTALEKAGFPMSEMKAMHGTTKVTFEHAHAEIPPGDFKLYLMPYKNKSGGEVRNIVKQLFYEDKETAKVHFGNYTQIKEDVLAESILTYKKSTGDQKKVAKDFVKGLSGETKAPKAEEKPKEKAVPKEEPKTVKATPVEEPKEKVKKVTPANDTNTSSAADNSELTFLNQIMTSLQVRMDILKGRGATINRPVESKISQAEQDRLDKLELEELGRSLKDVDTHRHVSMRR